MGAMMAFWSLSLALASLAMVLVLLPVAMGFSPSRMVLDQPPKGFFARLSTKAIRTALYAMEETSSGDLAERPSGFDAEKFFHFAGVDLDIGTFLVEEINKHRSVAMNSSVEVYSAEGSLGGRPGASLPVRIYWTTQKSSADEERNDDLNQILRAFGDSVVDCWIDQSKNDGNKVQRMINTPDELKAALGAVKPEGSEVAEMELQCLFEELILTDNRGDARINADIIEGVSLQPQIFLDRDGSVYMVFSANFKHEAAFRKGVGAVPTSMVTNQTVWWQTLDLDCNRDPYGVLSRVWTDEQFRSLIPSLGGDEESFLRLLAIRIKSFATITRQRASTIGSVFQREDRVLPRRKSEQEVPGRAPLVLQRLKSIAGISLLVGLFLRIIPSTSLRKVLIGFLHAASLGLVDNSLFLRSMMVWFTCVFAIEFVIKPALQRTWPIEKKSSVVESLSTFSIAMQSVGIFVYAVQETLVGLVKVPMLASLKFLSMTIAWWKRKRSTTKLTLFDGMIERLFSQIGNRNGSCPYWINDFVLAPIREELVFRFAFDKVWHGLLRAFGVNSAAALNASPHLPQTWIWANSLIFGLVHVSNWLPVKLMPFVPVDDGESDLWYTVFGALFQSSVCFLSAFYVLNPLYVRHGVCASIGAHAAMNLPNVIARQIFDTY